jgi:hypothetical protein
MVSKGSGAIEAHMQTDCIPEIIFAFMGAENV